MSSDLIHSELTFKIIGACLQVHKHLGCGFLEPVYQEALAIEFDLLNIPFEKEKDFSVYYKGSLLEKYYRADFVCFDKIIVELKALSALSGDHQAQLLNYLKVAKLQVGLLVNFGAKSLQHKRMVLTCGGSTDYADYTD